MNMNVFQHQIQAKYGKSLFYYSAHIMTKATCNSIHQTLKTCAIYVP